MSDKLPECPFCGSKNITRIDQFYECRDCNRDFGRDFTSDDGRPLMDAVKEIRFRYGDTISGSVRVRIQENEDGGVQYEVYDSNGGGVDKVKGMVEAKEWNNVKKKLFEDYFVQDWDRVYLPKNDGKKESENNSWELVFAVNEDEEHKIEGVDAYPPYWNKVMKLMDPFFKKLEKD